MSTPKDLVGNPSKRRCPASFADLGLPAITKNGGAPALRRWKATWDALSSALGNEQPPTPSAKPFDAVQAALVAAQIKRVLPLLPTSQGGDFDRDFPHLSYPIGPDELVVHFQFAHTDSDGLHKMYRLKTAQLREDAEFASAPEEIAVVVSHSGFPDSLETSELRSADGEMIRLEMPESRTGEILAELENDYQQMTEADPTELRPGLHCSRCDVADLCRTFPAIDPSAGEFAPARRRRLHSRYRIMIPKSRLGEMDQCQRRVAWKTWFFIPSDLDHSWEPSAALAVGNRFHSLMAQALLADDPGPFFDGDPEMEHLWSQHRTLPCTEGLSITATEFPLGFTARLPSGESIVSVVPYGLADAVGREPDGTPAVIDHKTGRTQGGNPREAEIYALGALLRIQDADSVATHIHRLSTQSDDPVCDRKVWTRDQIGELAAGLLSLAKTAARWDLSDATSPPFRVGEWCSTCPFEQRCRSHR